MAKVSKEAKVGVFAVLAITLLYLGFNYLKGVEFFSNTNTYYVVYEDVAGLTRSNPVKISGYNVGRVSKILLLQNSSNKVLVELAISSDIILGKSSLATLNSGLFGTVSIVLLPGDLTKPIASGDTIGARIDPDLTELLKESAQPISDNLQVTLRKLNLLLDDLSGSGSELKKALKSFVRLSNSLNSSVYESKDSFKSVLMEFDTFSKNINHTLITLNPTLRNLKTFSSSLKNLNLNSTKKNIDALLKQLTLTAQILQKKEGTLGKLINDDKLYENMNETILGLDSLLNHINKNPNHFFSPFGKSEKEIEKMKKKKEKKLKE